MRANRFPHKGGARNTHGVKLPRVIGRFWPTRSSMTPWSRSSSTAAAEAESTAEHIVYGALDMGEEARRRAARAVQEGAHNFNPSRVRSPCRRRDLPMPSRSARAQTASYCGSSAGRARAEKSCATDCPPAHRRRHNLGAAVKARRHPSNGRVERRSPISLEAGRERSWRARTTERPATSHHGPHRCRQDHDHRRILFYNGIATDR